MRGPAGVNNSRVIDLIMHDPHSDEVILVIVEDRPWDAKPERLFQLQEKINSYLAFVLDGHMERKYPDAKGKRVAIELDCDTKPDQETMKFLEQVQRQIAVYEIPIRINVR